MLRSLTPWLVGFLIGVCVWLWTFAPETRRPFVMLGRVEERKSPMDMPDWYQAKWEQGERYVEVGPMRQIAVEETKPAKHKAATVRGYW